MLKTRDGEDERRREQTGKEGEEGVVQSEEQALEREGKRSNGGNMFVCVVITSSYGHAPFLSPVERLSPRRAHRSWHHERRLRDLGSQ